MQNTIDYFADNWEDIADIIDQETKETETKETETKETKEVSVWKTDYKETNISQEYIDLFPSLNPDTDKEMNDNTQRDKVKQERRLKKSATNIFAILDDDDDDEEEEPTAQVQRQVIVSPKPIVTKSKPIYRARPKSKLCKCITERTICHYGERCRYAHSLQELQPDRCKYGQKCRCITIGYDKFIRNNQRSQRVCMYTHDESHQDYLRRTGLDKYRSISVSTALLTQATEMARVTGFNVER